MALTVPLLGVLPAAAFAVSMAVASGAAQTPVAAPATPTVAFHSNGCSGFREARFFSCCFTHDLAFWAGGNRSDRRRADLTLRRCLLDISHDHPVSDFGYFLMLLWSVAGYVVDDGWARAWRGTGHGRYDALTPEQVRVVAGERKRICQTLKLNPKTGRYRVDDSIDPVREVWPAQARQICDGALPPG